MDGGFVIFAIYIIILLFSVVLHEVAHGAVAGSLGDPTARLLGRLTLNPLKHLDPIGSVFVPVVTSLLGVPFGWAKPVPYNPHNLRNKRWGEALVGFAGPGTNIFLALVFGITLRIMPADMLVDPKFELGVFVLGAIVMVNLLLAIFNLVPIPPLDGSKLLFTFFNLPYSTRIFLEQYGFVFLLFFLFFGFQLIFPIISAAFVLIVGGDAFQVLNVIFRLSG